MSTKKTPAEASATNYTSREMALMAAACQSFKGDPPLDIERFAGFAGLTTGSARNAWAALKKKIAANSSADPSDPGTPKEPKTPNKGAANSANKRTLDKFAEYEFVEEGELTDPAGEQTSTPSKTNKAISSAAKKPRKSAKAKAKEAAVQDDESDQEGYSFGKPKAPKSPVQPIVKAEPVEEFSIEAPEPTEEEVAASFA